MDSKNKTQTPITPNPSPPPQKIKPTVSPEFKENAPSQVAASTASEKPQTIDKKIPAINVVGFTKKFKKFVATKNISFKVGHGVIHGFIGPNGSGKTTTIKAMIGAYIPTSGVITINGNKAGSTHANRLIGYIPERASFPKYLNTIEYLVSMAKLSGLKGSQAKTKCTEILDNLGLLGQAKRKPIGFSSGMQKKILLAQALITNPSILILDEPAANLDPTARKELYDSLVELRNQGKTILISSHILSELERIIDEVTFVYYGDVIYSGLIEQLLTARSNVFIKTDDNEKAVQILQKTKRYEIGGDIKTEFYVAQLNEQGIKHLFMFLAAQKDIKVRSFRSNDLQSIYDHLIDKSVADNKGSQSLSGQKVIAMRHDNVNAVSGPGGKQ